MNKAITDINTAGQSAVTLETNGGKASVHITGTWNGATVYVKRKNSAGTYKVAATLTEDSYLVIEAVGPQTFVTETSIPGSAPVLSGEWSA